MAKSYFTSTEKEYQPLDAKNSASYLLVILGVFGIQRNLKTINMNRSSLNGFQTVDCSHQTKYPLPPHFPKGPSQGQTIFRKLSPGFFWFCRSFHIAALGKSESIGWTNFTFIPVKPFLLKALQFFSHRITLILKMLLDFHLPLYMYFILPFPTQPERFWADLEWPFTKRRPGLYIFAMDLNFSVTSWKEAVEH